MLLYLILRTSSNIIALNVFFFVVPKNVNPYNSKSIYKEYCFSCLKSFSQNLLESKTFENIELPSFHLDHVQNKCSLNLFKIFFGAFYPKNV